MKKIKKVILFTHDKYQKNKDISKLSRFLKKNKIDTEILLQTTKDIRILSNGETLQPLSKIKKTSLKSYGLIIVFGGDGLFLSASKIAYFLNIPILGINFGKIGFLVDVDRKDILKKVYEIIMGDYIVDKRMLIDASVQDINDKKISCINLIKRMNNISIIVLKFSPFFFS